MTCDHHPGGLVVCRGPRLEARPTKVQRSAGWCPTCKRRRVQTLMAHVPVEPSYYGPTPSWRCPDGHDTCAPGWDFE